MTPGARIQAAIELLDRIEAPPPGEAALPADAMLNVYFRARRYIGAKDRRAIGDLVHHVLRARGRIDGRLGLPPDAVRTNRLRALFAALEADPETGLDALAAQCDGTSHRPAPLTPDERAALQHGLGATPPRPAEPWETASVPAWLWPDIARAYGAAAVDEMIAFLAPAPTDLRANTLRVTRAELQKALAAAGIAAEPCRFAPAGLRLTARANLAGLGAFKQGWFEVQDESSQLAVLLVGAAPGMRVLDLCAGAGGKSLALAAAMHNEGRIVATDADPRRLARLAPRLARSGATIIAPRTPAEAAAQGPYDRVLVDAPCSGSGTWRRHPDAKWRLTPERLAAYRAQQAALLREAARLVAPGGRLIFATCSILPDEGADQAEAFLAAAPQFRRVDAREAWRAALGTEAPFPGPDLRLTPRGHGTDGFFAAVLERAR